jgi:hypothetical protein
VHTTPPIVRQFETRRAALPRPPPPGGGHWDWQCLHHRGGEGQPPCCCHVIITRQLSAECSRPPTTPPCHSSCCCVPGSSPPRPLSTSHQHLNRHLLVMAIFDWRQICNGIPDGHRAQRGPRLARVHSTVGHAAREVHRQLRAPADQARHDKQIKHVITRTSVCRYL